MSPTAVSDRDCDELEQPLQHEIDPELQRELLTHPGKWALVTRSTLVALGSSPAEVIKKAGASCARTAMLYRIPDDSNTAFFF